MANVTLDEVIRDAASLPPEEQRRLLEVLRETTSQPYVLKNIEQIAKEQGKAPLDFAEIRRLGCFFPDDEDVDDLVNTVLRLRRDKSTRGLD